MWEFLQVQQMWRKPLTCLGGLGETLSSPSWVGGSLPCQQLQKSWLAVVNSWALSWVASLGLVWVLPQGRRSGRSPYPYWGREQRVCCPVSLVGWGLGRPWPKGAIQMPQQMVMPWSALETLKTPSQPAWGLGELQPFALVEAAGVALGVGLGPAGGQTWFGAWICKPGRTQYERGEGNYYLALQVVQSCVEGPNRGRDLSVSHYARVRIGRLAIPAGSPQCLASLDKLRALSVCLPKCIA